MKSFIASSNQTLIDQLLAEQGRLTAVEKFSTFHQQREAPAQQKFYRDLIPLSLPRPGEQFAFEVDLDACSGCKACVTACHSLNGLDEGETWRKVGTLLGGTRARPMQRTVTTACHHCVEPGCLDGCPVEAYEKDAVTGIVRHLDDQCIGCQYCLWTCPYDVPQFSTQRGIVRKCDMCQSRLADGEAPACVQACPNGAIAIRIVSQDAVRDAALQQLFLPDSPRPSLTIPATRFKSQQPLPQDLKSAQSDDDPEPAHSPLICMLVLTQVALGIFAAETVARMLGIATTELSRVLVFSGTAVLFVGLGASVTHLGRPLQAWRSFLGWKHSWLSREVIAFGGFAGLAGISATLFLLDADWVRSWFTPLSILVTSAGALSVFCSGMLYHATRRDFWSMRYTAGRFFGTSLVMGAAALFAVLAVVSSPFSSLAGCAVLVSTLVKLGWEVSFLKILDDETPSALRNSAMLLTTKLRWVTGARLTIGLLGGLCFPFLYFADAASAATALGAFAFCLCGELLERYLFFTAVAPRRMPGGQ